MNEVISCIKSRRSVHRFSPEPVPEDLVSAVVEAGLYAPSAMNRQPCRAIVIRDRHTRDELARLNARIMGRNEGFDPFYGAPVVILVAADISVPTYLYDGSVMIENMLLAAHSLGLGACWIHRAKEELESEEGRRLFSGLGLNRFEGIGHCALGYSDEKPREAAARRGGAVSFI